MLKHLIVFAMCAFSTIVAGQNIEFKSSNFKTDKDEFRTALDGIKTGDEYLALGNEAIFETRSPGLNYLIAIKEYTPAQTINPNNGELNFKLGVCYANSTNPFKCIDHLKKAKELDPDCDPFMNYYYGYAMQLEGKYDEALKAYMQFEADYRKSDNFSKFITQRKNECKSGKVSITKHIRAWVDAVPDLNTEYDDYAPSITTDGSEIVLTSNKPNEHEPNLAGGYDADIYISTKRDGKWAQPKQIKGGVNTMFDDVSNNLSYDGTKMLLHRESDGQFDIYESELKGISWSNPAKMHSAISSSRANEKFAAYSEDGWSVYFSRDNANRSNGFDIMFSGMQSKQLKDYMAASMLTVVNSKFDDGPVYMHIDGETMYIASQGNESIGGYDIFVSHKIRGQWGKPENMGYPINTPYDDFYFATTANGKYAYIASNRAGGKGGFDVYKVTFWGPEKKPMVDAEDYLLASIAMPIRDPQIEATVDVNKKSFTVFKGTTIDALTSQPVEAEIEIIDNTTGRSIESFITNSATGKFIITLVSGKNYGIAVNAEGYLFHSENFDIPKGSADNLVDKTIKLKNIAIGSKIALRNIFFDTGKSILRPESNSELDRLTALLNDVPSLKIELSGHTDNTGSASFNMTLSQQRAEAVVNYLRGKGIDAGRMTAKGYGSSAPIATNNSESGRQENRRTEFEIKGN
jgi:outer membrane protein OmpA-like peptidoglycan-associated protein/tetratricopeptide (TPR) repeat protein